MDNEICIIWRKVVKHCSLTVIASRLNFVRERIFIIRVLFYKESVVPCYI